MTGIRYLTDEKGRRVAVQLDLAQHRELWEDIEDVLVTQERHAEEAIPYYQYRVERRKQLRQPSD